MTFENLETLPISRSEFLSLELFRQVSFESLAGYLLGCSIMHVQPGEVLIYPNCAFRRLLVVLDGCLTVHMDAADGLFLDEIKSGACAGEMSVFDNTDPSAWVIVKEPSRLLVIDAPTAIAMLNASHDLCLNLLHILSQRVRYSNKVVHADKYHIRCIEENATVDSLTSLHNRRWLEQMYTRELHRCHSDDRSLCAAMLDIDHFKHINDTHGHLAGDQVLIAVSKTLVHCLRPTDMPVRYGGEEYSIFLPSTSLIHSQMVAERIRAAIQATTVRLQDGTTLSVTISIGIAMRQAGDTVESLLQKADKALYLAKREGRNRICAYTDMTE
jgi:diguanylate cyclase (GGDEF)-like protein